MNPRFEATNAALLHFDEVDQPALDALRTKEAMNLSAFMLARRSAADRVRAAFHYVRSGRTIEPAHLPDADELSRLLSDGPGRGRLLSRGGR